MKKILLIVFILFTIVSISVFANDWFEPIMNIKMSYNLGDDVELITDDGYYTFVDVLPENTIAFDITVGFVLFEFLWGEGQFITYNTLLDWNPIGGMFSPYQMEYGFRAGVQWMGFRAGYEHWCYHPVSVFGEYPVQRYGGVDQIFIEFDMTRLLLQKSNKK